MTAILDLQEFVREPRLSGQPIHRETLGQDDIRAVEWDPNTMTLSAELSKQRTLELAQRLSQPGIAPNPALNNTQNHTMQNFRPQPPKG